MLNVKSFSKTNKLQQAAFVQLKDPETGELLVDDSGNKVGIELYSVSSSEFKRALRSTADLGLTRKEDERQKEINKAILDGIKPSDENLDFLDYCEEKLISRFQRVYALATKKLHNIKLDEENAREFGIKLTASGKVSESVENISKLYSALPDLTAQIGDAMSDKQNFINA